MSFGAGDKDFFYAYRDILPQKVKKFRPDIMLISAGYDIHARDPLSGINVTNEGMRISFGEFSSVRLQPIFRRFPMCSPLKAATTCRPSANVL